MKRPTLRKPLLALLVAASLPAFASSYYVVTPVPGKKVMADAITVSLGALAAPAGQVGIAYGGLDLRSALTVTGDPSYTGYGVAWSVVAGALPAGLVLNSNGTVTGTPTAAGQSQFTIRAAYKTKTGEQQYQVSTYSIQVSLAAGSAPQAIVGQAYSYDLKPLLTVSGDSAYAGSGVSWSVVANTLPVGLYLTADGRIAGTPTAGGTGSLTARASYKNAQGDQAYQVVSLNVGVALATATPPQAIVGQDYSYDLKPLLTVSGDSAYTGSGVTWSVVASSLPAGLYLTADGHIGGTPSVGGTGSLTARATYRNVNGDQVYQVVSLNIVVSLADATLPVGVASVAYPSFDFKRLLTVSGDSAYTQGAATWSVAKGNLPPGLTLGSDGVIAGTPSTSVTTAFTLAASYRGVSDQHAYTMEIDTARASGNVVATSSTDFGIVKVGSSATQSFTFTNTGNAPATGLYAAASGAGLAITATTCGTTGAPVSLATGASCTFTARYAPTSAGAMAGNVSVNWSGPSTGNASLAVTGAAQVDYSSLMAGYTSNAVQIGQNSAWASAVWYWNTSGAESSAAVGTVEFRRTITVSGTAPVSVSLYGATDDVFTSLAVNGTTVGSNLATPFSSLNSTPQFTLQPGVNVIAVQVTNAGSAPNPAGMTLQVRDSTGAVIAGWGGWMFKP